MFDLDKEYTADEINEIIDKGWNSDEEYLEIVHLVRNCKMNEEEREKLRNDGYLDELYGCYEAGLLDD